MNPPTTTPSALESALRLLGWALLVGGLCISLFSHSITGLGSLALSLKELGFPSGTLCVAGILSLALGSIRGRRHEEVSPRATVAMAPASTKAAPPEKPKLQELEDRLISELDRRHEELRNEIHEVSALIEASLRVFPVADQELPMAAGAELISKQLLPLPRVRPHLSTGHSDHLDVTVELEDLDPDESTLWSHDRDKQRTGDLEDRLSGEVLTNEDFVWDFPTTRQSEPHNEDLGQRPREAFEPEVEEELSSDEEPTIDRKNISWLDWDEDDLV